MTALVAAMAPFAALVSAAVGATVSGDVPPAIRSPVRAVWIEPGGRPAGHCEIAGAEWTCTVPDRAHGLVAVLGTDAVAFASASSESVASMQVHRWGGVLIVTPGSAGDDALHNVRVAATMPERSAYRPRTARFLSVPQPGVDILKLSDTTFWIAGDDVDRDAVLAIEGPFIASMWIPLDTVVNGGPEPPFEVAAAAPLALTGRVQNGRGEDIDGVAVDLYVPLRPPGAGDQSERESGQADPAAADALAPAAMRVAQVRSQAGGIFTFDRLNGGPFGLAATDSQAGRASATIRSVAEPVVLRLTSPTRASGRVLRHGIPVPGATIRFVPDPDAFKSSADPLSLASEPQSSGSDGRFSLVLPPQLAGTLVITAPDRSAARIRLSAPGKQAEIAVGDVPIPDPVQATIRLMGAAFCTVSAAGPLGSLGISIVAASARSELYVFDFPEPGEWALNASCGGRSVVLQPQILSVPRDDAAPAPVVDVRIVR